MDRIVRRTRILPLTRVHEIVITTLGIAGLAGVAFVEVLSTLALYR